MYVGLRDLFKIGIGPSSSHTMGPMKAAARFASMLPDRWGVRVTRVTVELFGSLALTGRGHGTDSAVLIGLEGREPEAVDPATITSRVAEIRRTSVLQLRGAHSIQFVEERDLVYRKTETLPFHPNGMRFTALDHESRPVAQRVYYSVGGGFIHEEGIVDEAATAVSLGDMPFPFDSAARLLAYGDEAGLAISEIVRANEVAAVPREPVSTAIRTRWSAMRRCVARGLATPGELPGGLHVIRRAPKLFLQLNARGQNSEPLTSLDWTTAWAIAANEENAAGGQIVTAPTNGAAGVIPAVLHYYVGFVTGAGETGVEKFFLTATAIGALCKMNASISGAEIGCQGEVGVACAMAAGGLVAALGGSNRQVEQAAEIGIEHHLGLTCDPVKGLVQIPCIERNAVGAVKAITAARMAMNGDGLHRVSLDQAIATMRETGRDMQDRYKETALGGLALALIEC